MSRWFLSYHSPDQPLAERVKAAVERKDSTSSVFFAPTHLRAGGAWTDQLAQELAEANAFILLIGEAGVGKWQIPEYDEALDRWVKSGRIFPLIVVLLDGQTAPGLPFLRQLHWIVTPDPASEKDVARIYEAASGRGARPPELWRYASPYRGLEAMEEKDSDYFFGRARETVEALNALQAQGRLAVLIGNSGVGKSSLAQAGVMAALKRQAWPDKARDWPAVFQNSRQWCFVTMRPAEPLKALVDCFLDTWQLAAGHEREKELQGWIELLLGKTKLSGLIDETERRFTELKQSKPPAFFLYIDQGEELYTQAVDVERRRFAKPTVEGPTHAVDIERQRFSKLIVEGLSDARLRVMMSLRSDFYGSLQNDRPLSQARLQIDVRPLGEDELREVVSRPAQLLGAHFETDRLVEILAQRAAEDSVKDAGALPLLSYTLDDMWGEMLRAGDGVLRFPARSVDLGRVLVDRADKFLAQRPGAEDVLKRLLTLKLATVREDGEPTRRRADRTEFSDEEWGLVSELAGYPYRLLVTVTPEAGETYAEVAHEAIFRGWDTLKGWVAAEREFLAWRNGLEAAHRAFGNAETKDKNDALLMGFALTQAQRWLANRKDDIQSADQAFITESRSAARRRKHRAQALVGALALAMIVGAVAWWNQDRLKQEIYALANVRALSTAQEAALKPGDPFKECRDCPEMIVVPGGRFVMGSPEGEGMYEEHPQHEVRIPKPFAVAKFELTFDEWDACAAHGDCGAHIRDSGWGRGRRPAINVSLDDAQTYVKWLSRITGKAYRLLSEADYEYAARAGTETEYPWGDEIKRDGKAMANCAGCGSPWDGKQTAPVCGWQEGDQWKPPGCSFAANRFGLYDMAGNIWEWTEDCWHGSYEGAPADGSAWTSGDCNSRRGGSWFANPVHLRSANRRGINSDLRLSLLGIRVARTLTTGAEAATATQETR
jgi:formylglycine-generating enzyme required for sulfatase activity